MAITPAETLDVTLPKDLLSILDWSPADLEKCLDVTGSLKRDRRLGRQAPTANRLSGQHVAMLFEKPSLRTRATFEIAVRELGGDIIEPQLTATFGDREAVADVAKSLERWVTAVVIRTFAQERLDEFARATTTLHVINALSDTEHPCQALADVFTLQEYWQSFRNRTIAFIGDGNNVATSLAHASVMLGLTIHIASPLGFNVPDSVIDDITRIAKKGASIKLFSDPWAAVNNVDAVYTDAWTSMGQETEAKDRRSVFLPYQVNTALMAKAKPDAIFMHCLPAHRGDEVTDEVMDASTSVVFDQAENRLHTEKALLALLLSNEGF